MSSDPVTTVSASLDTLASRSAFCREVSNTTPASTPGRVPVPPKMDTPPNRTAATTVSSRPVALSARALEYRSVQNTPTSPATAPDTTKSQNFNGPTAIPANAAATGFDP